MKTLMLIAALLVSCAGRAAEESEDDYYPPVDQPIGSVSAEPVCVSGTTRCTEAGMESCIWGRWSVPVKCEYGCAGGDKGCLAPTALRAVKRY